MKVRVLLTVAVALLATLAPMTAFAAPPLAPAAAPAAVGPAWTVSAPYGLRLRQIPHLTGNIILVLYHGEKVYDLGQTQYAQGITWAKVRTYRYGYYYDGYAASAYLGGHSNPGGPAVSGLKVIAGGLNVRSGPGRGYSIRRIVPYGTVLQAAGGQQYDGVRWWTPVSINGTTLWAASQYLQVV